MRERWFYAEGHRRMGPVPRRELLEALLQLTDPRTCLIWRRGLPAWMPAADVPEIDSVLAPARSTGASAHARGTTDAAPSPSTSPGDTSRRMPRPAVRPAPRPAERRGKAPLFAAVAAAVIVIAAIVAWVAWPRAAAPPIPDPGAAVRPHATSAPTAVDGAGPAATPSDTAAGGGFAGWGDLEAELPAPELRRLRGVGGWEGDKLTITLYNGSSWRVTEIFVLTSRMDGDRFVDAVAPQLLLPVGGAPVQGAVQDLLQKVAPDRKRAGVNPADTGPFEAVLGPQPTGYRWKIERARGYPPRSGP